MSDIATGLHSDAARLVLMLSLLVPAVPAVQDGEPIPLVGQVSVMFSETT